jgi:MFS family permease
MIGHRFRRKNIRKTTHLSLIRMILAIGFACIDTVWVLYMDSFGLSESSIGFISAGLVLVTLAFSFFSTILLEKIDEIKILLYSLIIIGTSYLVISFTDVFWIFILLTVIITMISILKTDAFDILFRDISNDSDLNEDEGLMYTLINVGWLFGPLIAGFILVNFGMDFVFITSSMFIFLGGLILYKMNLEVPKKVRESIDSNIFKNLKEFFSDKKLIVPYVVAAGIEIWWALVYIYVPLFIIKNGLSEMFVGYFLSVVIIPLVLFEFVIGKLSLNYGFRVFFFWGFFLLMVAGVVSYFSPSFYFTLIVLGLASIPMSFLEPIQDSFFFKQISSNDEEKFYPIFATAADFGSFVGKISVAVMLVFMPEKFAYLVIAGFMGILSLVSLKIRN